MVLNRMSGKDSGRIFCVIEKLVGLWVEIPAVTKTTNFWSQCSTVVRNTVVRATIKVNGKHPNLGTRRAQTLWPIDLKFDVGDYVSGMTPHSKSENRPRRAAPAYGWNIMFKCFLTFFIFFADFLRSSGEHISGSIATVFVSNDVVRWGLIS